MAINASDIFTAPSGTSGTSGYSGESGTSGTSGYSGVGESGQSGYSGLGGGGTTWSSVSGYLAMTAGLGILADTSVTGFSALLPESPSEGDMTSFMDAKGTWSSNNLLIARNGENIQNDASDLTCDVDNGSFDLVYTADGWKLKDYLYL